MVKYRNKNKQKHRKVHPKIFVWSHTEKAEIEYFQDFKNYLETPLLMPKKELCWKPQELIEKVIKWKREEIYDEDRDQVWCIFDVDDFCCEEQDKVELLRLIAMAEDNNIKIALMNECFELWILLHFERLTSPVYRGKDIEKRIQKFFKKNKLGEFKKNQSVFKTLLPFQAQAISNAKKLLSMDYEKIDWVEILSKNGNPTTSIHFLIEEINRLMGKH
ncbi:MAG: RloB family protein [Candidatus Moranbacteria bacterium]|nr:RloB family protein [Candidatus Moranbacteria bacterium]